MNRLWVRLSLSFSMVLLAVLGLPIMLFWMAFLFRGRGMMYPAVAHDPALVAAVFFMLTSATLFSLFVGVIAGVLVSRGLSKQVNQLVLATREITPNNLKPRVQVAGVHELQELALSFNRMVAELDRSQQIRRNMLADVSHELLTPLTVLEGNLRAMLDGVYALNEEEISTLYDETHHLIELVKELRQLTEAEAHQLPLNREPTDLSDLVSETVNVFEPLTKERDVELRQVAYGRLPTIWIDRQRLRQVLSNLLSNALRHTPRGGVITIETKYVDNVVRLIVEDTGNGLTDADMEHIFDRFYRTDGTRRWDTGGAGLGLAIVKALVEAHGGVVSAASTPPHSTRFIISLPVIELMTGTTAA